VTIGLIGLGLVGIALAERLTEAGEAVLGHDPNAQRAALLPGRTTKTPADILEACEVVILAVYDADQVEQVLFGGSRPMHPVTCICVTTCPPDRIAAIAARWEAQGHAFIEFPLSGNSAQIRSGNATGLAAGHTAARAAVHRILAILAPERLDFGGAGEASVAKLGINLVLQLNRAALAEGLAFAAARGLDPAAFLDAASRSAARSAVMAGKGPKMVARDYRPESHIAQTLKDADMILDEARTAGQRLPLMTAQRALLAEAIALMGGAADSAAVMEALRPRDAS
jgi:3-hydroxyisobutyrate dehydrogenase-like beta-hydroxyacid dehydrogenase